MKVKSHVWEHDKDLKDTVFLIQFTVESLEALITVNFEIQMSHGEGRGKKKCSLIGSSSSNQNFYET